MYITMLLVFFVTSFCAWILLIAGIRTKRETEKYLEAETTPATGVITDYVRKDFHPGRRGRYTYWMPVVEYAANGKTYSAPYRDTLDQAKFPIGTHVDILYDFRDPTQFHLAEDPVVLTPGLGAIRASVIWILLSIVLAIVIGLYAGDIF